MHCRKTVSALLERTDTQKFKITSEDHFIGDIHGDNMNFINSGSKPMKTNLKQLAGYLKAQKALDEQNKNSKENSGGIGPKDKFSLTDLLAKNMIVTSDSTPEIATGGFNIFK